MKRRILATVLHWLEGFEGGGGMLLLFALAIWVRFVLVALTPAGADG